MSKKAVMISPLSEEKQRRIAAMLERSGGQYSLTQINGQRKYQRYDDQVLGEPTKGCEVFVGRLPRDCYEDELVPLFSEIGSIRLMRLMMDFSGTNRGYAFVLYDDPQTAKEAVDKLDNYLIRPRHNIGVMVSWNKTRLFIGGIPKYKSRKDVLKEMNRVTENVKEVILYMSVYNHKNRGFCFVEYQTHHDAAMARRRLGESFVLWGKHEVRVDWADPEPEVDEETMSQVKILHVRNLPLNVGENELKDIFSFDGLHIERVKKIRDFAFIHFESRAHTEEALKRSTATDFIKENPSLKRLQVTLARPQKCRQVKTRSLSCDSVPTDPNPISTPILNNAMTPQPYYPLHTPDDQVRQQFKYYQNLWAPQNQLVPQTLSSPLKYDNVLTDDKGNFNFFVVWVPVMWMPHNYNKEILPEDSYQL